MIRIARLFLFGGFLFCHVALAYKEPTHEKLSEVAANSSILKTGNDVLPNMGLQFPIDDDRQLFPNSKGEPKNILNLIKDGANFEDEGTTSRNHFYDPKYDRPLTVFGVYLGARSLDWALEDQAVSTGQDFSFRDIRGYYYKALTLPTEQERFTYFGRTFEGLGHVIHHIQDMAQPQHVRNDIHLDRYSLLGLNPLYNPSRYEEFTNNHRTELLYNSSAIQFSNPRAFWTNDSGTGLAQFTNRNFVSAGTNFQMLDGQVAANSIYPNPQPIGGESSIDIQQLFAEEKLPPPRDQNGNLLQGDIVFIGSSVDGVPHSKASTLSIFDQDLKAYNKTVTYDADPLDPSFNAQVTVDRVFTLNQFNFRAAYPHLIPKAVGYSAGLIDYFFRGKIELDVEYDTSTDGQYLIRNHSEEEMKGDFTLYYDGVDGKRYPLKGDSNAITWRDVTIGPNKASAPLKSPKMPNDPRPKTDEYFLVFKGEMGEERPADAQSVGAVVAKNKQKLFWEPWREELTDNRPWIAGAGTVNNQVGPNSQQVQNGQLVEYVGAGGAGFVVWKAANAEDMLPTQFMKLGITCSENALTTNWNVYAYLFIAPTINGQIDWGHSQAIPFAGGAGPSSGFDLMNKKIPVTPTEYVVDLRLLNRLGLKQIGYMSIETIGFDMDLTCSVDYLDFSEEPFEKVSEGAVYFP